MSLYGVIKVSTQFNLDKIKENIDMFKRLYGVNTEQEVYRRYLSDMSKKMTEAIEGVEGVAYQGELLGVHSDSEESSEHDETLGDMERESYDAIGEEALESSREINSIMLAIENVGIEHGLVTKVVVNELNSRLKNFTKVIGVPVETAEMGEDYYLVYEEYGSGEEKHWNPEGDK